METVKRTGVLRRYSDWQNTKFNLSEYVRKGDSVDEAFYMYILEITPPLDYGSIIQMGEPHSHTEEGKPTFVTLQQYGSDWIYTGIRTARDRVEFVR